MFILQSHRQVDAEDAQPNDFSNRNCEFLFRIQNVPETSDDSWGRQLSSLRRKIFLIVNEFQFESHCLLETIIAKPLLNCYRPRMIVTTSIASRATTSLQEAPLDCRLLTFCMEERHSLAVIVRSNHYNLLFGQLSLVRQYCRKTGKSWMKWFCGNDSVPMRCKIAV